MPKIFISYARDKSHGQNLAVEAQHQLQSSGFEVFRDGIGLKPGDVWYSKLEFELESSDAMVLVVSEKVRSSKWVHNEVSMAQELGLPLIPITAEKIRMPLWLRHLQVLDFSGERNWSLLKAALGRQLPHSAPEQVPHSVPSASKQIFLYQTGGGVDDEALFFGRRELISQIVNRAPANYLIVGGRQIGKSSLLKALKRDYAYDPKVECHYLMLSNELMVPRLARALQLTDIDCVETFANAVEERILKTRKHCIFLIDEADLFIKHEQSQGYTILNVLRRLSEQGQCSFVLAGFWHLYQHAVLDYQSPLRNFGEVLEVGALEFGACRQLATQPMKTLNLTYASSAIVKNMIEQCGQRANLITSACQQLIQSLPADQLRIEMEDIHRVLHSREMSKRFDGWVVGISQKEQHYDQLVVYATIGKADFSTNELIQLLEEQGSCLDIAELERALSRLELSFTLTRTKNRWYYSVPLFVEYFEAEDPETKLETLLRSDSAINRGNKTSWGLLRMANQYAKRWFN